MPHNNAFALIRQCKCIEILGQGVHDSTLFLAGLFADPHSYPATRTITTDQKPGFYGYRLLLTVVVNCRQYTFALLLQMLERMVIKNIRRQSSMVLIPTCVQHFQRSVGYSFTQGSNLPVCGLRTNSTPVATPKYAACSISSPLSTRRRINGKVSRLFMLSSATANSRRFRS